MLGRRYSRSYEVAATRAVMNAYRLLGSIGFLRLFRLLGDTGDTHSLTTPVISGMALFLKAYKAELSGHVFVKRLSAMDPEEITRRGRMDLSTNNRSLR